MLATVKADIEMKNISITALLLYIGHLERVINNWTDKLGDLIKDHE